MRRHVFVMAFGSILSVMTLSCWTYGAEPSCTPEYLVKSCGSLAQKGVSLSTGSPLQSGTVVFNAVAAMQSKNESTLKKLASMDERSRLTTEAIFKKVRTATRSLVTGDALESTWTSEQKAMLERLESVEIKFLDTQNELCQENPVANFPTLWYFKQGHSILVCPSATKLHPAVLKRAIAHEMGHVISPCQLSRSFYGIDQKRLGSNEFMACAKGKSGWRNAQQWREYFGTRHFMIPDHPQKEAELKGMEACGVIKKKDATIQEPTLFKEIHSCLAGEYRSAYENWLDGETSKRLELEPESPAGAVRFEVAEQNPIKCLKEVDEHFADAVSARVFAAMIETEQGSGRDTDDDVKSSLTDWAAWMCFSRDPKAETRGYPSSETRFRVATSEPLIQGKLHCRTLAVPKFCSLQGFSATGAHSVPKSGGTRVIRKTKAVE